MATITVGAGIAAAAGVAVAGAVGLGLLGLAAGSRGGRRRGGRRRQGNFRRFGREAGEEVRQQQEEQEALERTLELIRVEDVTGCGLRLMCELAATPSETLLQEQMAILNLVGPSVRPGEGLLPPGATGDYLAAKSLGAAGGDCGLAFPECPLGGTQLMDQVMAYLP
ncbi:uncharacterized protein LOC121853348 [Homarus americanus]|nr:uncharacterized protein LOC121853348 [Homarus americanus]